MNHFLVLFCTATTFFNSALFVIGQESSISESFATAPAELQAQIKIALEDQQRLSGMKVEIHAQEIQLLGDHIQKISPLEVVGLVDQFREKVSTDQNSDFDGLSWLKMKFQAESNQPYQKGAEFRLKAVGENSIAVVNYLDSGLTLKQVSEPNYHLIIYSDEQRYEVYPGHCPYPISKLSDFRISIPGWIVDKIEKPNPNGQFQKTDEERFRVSHRSPSGIMGQSPPEKWQTVMTGCFNIKTRLMEEVIKGRGSDVREQRFAIGSQQIAVTSDLPQKSLSIFYPKYEMEAFYRNGQVLRFQARYLRAVSMREGETLDVVTSTKNRATIITFDDFGRQRASSTTSQPISDVIGFSQEAHSEPRSIMRNQERWFPEDSSAFDNRILDKLAN